MIGKPRAFVDGRAGIENMRHLDELYIQKVDLKGIRKPSSRSSQSLSQIVDGLIVTFSDRTTAAYVAEELLELRPDQEPIQRLRTY
jgi:hypothetical protein